MGDRSGSFKSTESPTHGAERNCSRGHKSKPNQKGKRGVDQVSHVDYVTTNALSLQGESQLYIFEGNQAVIKMIIKGSSPTMRHVSGTHTASLDGLFDKIKKVLATSPIVLCVCALFIYIFLSPVHHSRWGCSTKCALWMRCSVAYRQLHWNALGGSAIRRPLRHRTLQPSNPWDEKPTLRRAARVPPLQPSNCFLHLEEPPQSRKGFCPS